MTATARLVSTLVLAAMSRGVAAPTTPTRPTVALALAGGSALGLTHVGVLRWFEEHHVPVDAIAGTSMGGLIGALYATGHSPQEIADFVRDASLERLFSATPYTELSFRRKEDRRDFPNELELGWKRGLQFPSGLNAGQGVGNMLSRFTAPYGDVVSFEELPTPFACVATDLVSGEAIVFRGGSLHEALRATMSLPAVFAPVEIGSLRLVDGGLVNNLPIDVARAFGTDVVIAVSLDATDDRDSTDPSLVSIARRALDIMVRKNQRDHLALADRILYPELQGFNTRAFERTDALANRGYEETQRHADWLLPLALDDDAWIAYQNRRASRRRSLHAADAIVVVGAGRETDRIELDLRQALGPTPEADAIEAAMDRLAGRGPFATATYRGVVRGGRETLLVSVGAKSYRSPYINLGVSIDGSRLRDARVQFDGRVTFRGLARSEWRTDFSLGSGTRLASEYVLALGRAGWFGALRGVATSSHEDLYEGTDRVANYDIEQIGLGLDTGVIIARSHEIRAGIEWSHVRESVSVGSPEIPGLRGQRADLRLLWTMENTEAALLPERGARARVALGWTLAHPELRGGFASLTARVTGATRVLGDWPLLATLRAATIPHRTTRLGAFTLGGPGELSALGVQQMRGDNLGNFTLRVLRPLQRNPLGVFRRTYLAVGGEVGAAFATVAAIDPFVDATIEFIGVSRFGVLQLGAALGENGRRSAFFRFGRPF